MRAVGFCLDAPPIYLLNCQHSTRDRSFLAWHSTTYMQYAFYLLKSLFSLFSSTSSRSPASPTSIGNVTHHNALFIFRQRIVTTIRDFHCIIRAPTDLFSAPIASSAELLIESLSLQSTTGKHSSLIRILHQSYLPS
jgi:hypothetical protein